VRLHWYISVVGRFPCSVCSSRVPGSQQISQPASSTSMQAIGSVLMMLLFLSALSRRGNVYFSEGAPPPKGDRRAPACHTKDSAPSISMLTETSSESNRRSHNRAYSGSGSNSSRAAMMKAAAKAIASMPKLSR